VLACWRRNLHLRHIKSLGRTPLESYVQPSRSRLLIYQDDLKVNGLFGCERSAMLLQLHSRAADQVVDAERVGQRRRIPIIDRKRGILLERRVEALKGKAHRPVEAWIERPLDSACLL